MKSELSFLLDLILDDQIPKPVKTRLLSRIRDVEKNYATVATQATNIPRGTRAQINSPIIAAQSPSMQRLMDQNPDLIPAPPVPTYAEITAQMVPVTAQAAGALAQRQALMNNALKEKPEAGRTGPRKF